MATVNRANAPHKRQTQSKDDMRKTHHSDLARDDLRGAFAGDENKGPEKNQKDNRDEFGTKEKSRRLGRDSGRVPIK